MKNGFGERLQLLMDKKIFSQKDLADHFGCHRSLISKWISYKEQKPRRATIQRIAQLFGCSTSWLSDGVGEAYHSNENSLSIVGNGNIQAGRRVVKISGGSKVGTSDQQQAPSFVLDEDEARFIALVREVGGKQALRKFEAELLRLKQIIDKELK